LRYPRKRSVRPVPKTGWTWWLTIVVPVSWEVEVRGSQFKASPGKVTAKPYVKNKRAWGMT
jgi:hypothetical protein